MTNKSSEYSCPQCSTQLTWSTQNLFRPFCSSQCKNNDLIGWANENHVIEGSNMMNDLMSDELADAEQHHANHIPFK